MNCSQSCSNRSKLKWRAEEHGLIDMREKDGMNLHLGKIFSGVV